jgi:GTP-binding protein HflX
MEELLRLIEKNLDRGMHHAVFLLPYAMGGMLETLHSQGKVLQTEYTGEGIQVEAICDEALFGKLREYLV